MTDLPTPEGVSWMLAVYERAPYLADVKPPFYIGDVCLRDGVPRMKDMGERKIEEDDILTWNGLDWVTLGAAFDQEYLVQK